MGLKNWTTTFKSLNKTKGGFLGYTKYLQNENHRNHKDKNHKILDLGFDAKKVYINNLKLLDNANYEKVLEGKGGRPSTNMGVSVVISLPFDVNDDLLRKYTNELIKAYYIDLCKLEKINYNKNTFKEYKKLVFANVHQKNKGSKTQINLTLPHYLPNFVVKKIEKKGLLGKKIEEVQQINFKKIDMSKKKYSFLMKTLNNQLTLKILGKDFREYEVEQKFSKKRKKINEHKTKDLNLREKNIEEKENILELKENDFEKKFEHFKSRVFRLQRNQQIFEENQLNDETIKKYIERANRYLKEKNMDKFGKTLTLIENRENKVSEYHNIELSEFDDM